MSIRSAAVPAVLITLFSLAVIGCDDDEPPPLPVDDAPGSVTPEDVADADPESSSDSGAIAGTGGDGSADAAADAASVPGTAATRRTGTAYAVQLGAFTREANARGLVERLEAAGLPTWAPTAEVSGQSFQRVRVGATATVAEARSLAAELRERYETESWIAPVAADEELPPGIIVATSRLLRDG